MHRYRPLRLVLASIFFAAALAAPRIADPGNSLNRSIYVPIRLNVCEHIEDATLYRGETRVRSLPGEQTVQFTYYGDSKRLLPEIDEYLVTGKEKSGRDFEVKLTVSPADILVANRWIDLHAAEQLQDLGHKVDIRYAPVTVHLNCRDLCPRKRQAEPVAVTPR